MRSKLAIWTSCLLLLSSGGCLFPVRENVDREVCILSDAPLDLMPASPPKKAKVVDKSPLPKPKGFPDRLKIPASLPGAEAGPVELPPLDRNKPKEREQALAKLYPTLPGLDSMLTTLPGPEGAPLGLSDLQRLAMANSPVIRQAAADVEAARGQAIQAGLYPNPVFGYEGDTIGTGPGPGYQGGFVEQTIITGGKLKLKQAAATMAIRNAELAQRRAQIEVMSQVRSGYFGYLVARKRFEVTQALALFTDEVYRVQIDLVKAAQAAPYEPLQLRVLAMQARADVVQARNRVIASWKELAAALGVPGMPPTDVAGDIDLAIPIFDYDTTLARVLERHTDVRSAENNIRKARFELRLAQITPVPDVQLRVMLQKDYTSPPNFLAPSVAVGVPVPAWDRNQGNIRSGQGELLHAVEQSHRVRNELTARLAAAFEEYQNARVILGYYRDQILPDQVRVYRGVYTRHQQEPGRVDFGSIIVAQQTLANNINSYVRTLGDMWHSVVEVAELMQTDDLFGIVEQTEAITPIPELPELPCCHPCSPLHHPGFLGMDGNWGGTVQDKTELAPPPKPAPKKPDQKPEDKKKPAEALRLPEIPQREEP